MSLNSTRQDRKLSVKKGFKEELPLETLLDEQGLPDTLNIVENMVVKKGKIGDKADVEICPKHNTELKFWSSQL